MIIQRRKFLIGLVSSLAAPAIVKAANIMPVKVFNPKATMQQMLNYIASAQVELHVLYGSYKIDYLNGELKLITISENELFYDR